MKRSFSLIETLFSIILLSIVISGFLNLSLESVGFKNHIDLQTLKNKIVSEQYNSFSANKINIDFNIQQDSTISFTSGEKYTKYTYETDQFKLVKYDIPYKETTLASKVFE